MEGMKGDILDALLHDSDDCLGADPVGMKTTLTSERARMKEIQAVQLTQFTKDRCQGNEYGRGSSYWKTILGQVPVDFGRNDEIRDNDQKEACKTNK